MSSPKKKTYIKYDAETVGWQAIPAKPIIAQCVLFYQFSTCV